MIWTWIAVGLLSGLLAVVLIRNFILKFIILKGYRWEKCRKVVIRMIKDDMKKYFLVDSNSFTNFKTKVKSNLFATRVNLICKFDVLIEGQLSTQAYDIVFRNESPKLRESQQIEEHVERINLKMGWAKCI
jgi:hypothetical protein